MRHTLIALVLLLPACGGSSPVATPAQARLLGLAFGEAEDGDFDAAADLAQAAGVQASELALAWNTIETAPGVYGNPLLPIIDSYFPARGLRVHLVIFTLNTVKREVPADLENVAWDDPTMIARFKAMLDFLLAQLPTVELSGLAIGNEVDGVLSGQADYAAYRTFFEAARDHIRMLRPGQRVGVTAMYAGLLGTDRPHLQSLNTNADFISVTYYGINPDFTVQAPAAVRQDFDALAAIYPGRPIVLQECGYPSSPLCNSTEEKQREFVVEVFRAWDAHADQIDHIFFFKQTDWAAATVDGFLTYYGLATPEFRGYLESLGMRSWAGSGTDKPAWTALRQEAAARGW